MSDTPETILQEAQRLVHGDRGAAYGHPIDDFTTTAEMFQAIVNRLQKQGKPIGPEHVPLFMICVKLSRELEHHKRDNPADICGYCETLMMVKEKQNA